MKIIKRWRKRRSSYLCVAFSGLIRFLVFKSKINNGWQIKCWYFSNSIYHTIPGYPEVINKVYTDSESAIIAVEDILHIIFLQEESRQKEFKINGINGKPIATLPNRSVSLDDV